LSEAPASLRVDKWLWQARFFKTRALCASLIKSGKLRLNDQRVAKPSVKVQAGDVLNFPQARAARVIRVVAMGTRRGPAPEAQALYEDLAPPEDLPRPARNPRYDGKGRPSGKDRRPKRAFEADGLA